MSEHVSQRSLISGITVTGSLELWNSKQALCEPIQCRSDANSLESRTWKLNLVSHSLGRREFLILPPLRLPWAADCYLHSLRLSLVEA